MAFGAMEEMNDSWAQLIMNTLQTSVFFPEEQKNNQRSHISAYREGLMICFWRKENKS